MLATKQTKVLENGKAAQSWGDFLVSVWVLFIAFAICGVITMIGFPIGWKEVGTDYSAAAASAQSGASGPLEASALGGIGR